MNICSKFSGLLLLLASAPVSSASDLPRNSPEARGVSSEGMIQLVAALDQEIDAMHSLVVLRHGHVIAEGWWAPYSPSSKHVLYSLSKSFTSTAIGLAIAEGRLAPSDTVVDFFPDSLPPDASANLNAMRVRDLLTMSTGHQDEPPTSADEMSVASFLAHPVPHKPGTHFRYNTAATFMLSAIIQRLSGETVLDYLRPRLFTPLGIEGPEWEKNFEGICLGGYGLRVRTEDIAKFGQLYLQGGRWGDEQLLPAEWAEQAGARQMSNGSNPQSDWEQGYGFQFWRCRHGAFRGDGAFGQFCVIMPEQDIVVAITSGTKKMPAILDLLWQRLLPIVGTTDPLPGDPAATERLQKLLAGLAVQPAPGDATPPASRPLLNRRFDLEPNTQGINAIELASPDGGQTIELVVDRDGGTDRIPCANRGWAKSTELAPFRGGRLAQFPAEPIAGSFGWPADDTCTIKLCAYETPFSLSLRLKFTGEDVLIESESNVAFGPTKRPALEGSTR